MAQPLLKDLCSFAARSPKYRHDIIVLKNMIECTLTRKEFEGFLFDMTKNIETGSNNEVALWEKYDKVKAVFMEVQDVVDDIIYNRYIHKGRHRKDRYIIAVMLFTRLCVSVLKIDAANLSGI